MNVRTLDEAIEKEKRYAEIKERQAEEPQRLFVDDDREKEYRADIAKEAAEARQRAEWLEELKQYRAIGTPEECMAAVEKQKAKKPPVVNRPSIFVKVPVCPNCSTPEHYQPLYGKTKYCSNCGQKLDWSDEE